MWVGTVSLRSRGYVSGVDGVYSVYATELMVRCESECFRCGVDGASLPDVGDDG